MTVEESHIPGEPQPSELQEEASSSTSKKPRQKKLLNTQSTRPHLDLQQPDLQLMLGLLPGRLQQALQRNCAGPQGGGRPGFWRCFSVLAG
jgi:hypothetical protein